MNWPVGWLDALLRGEAERSGDVLNKGKIRPFPKPQKSELSELRTIILNKLIRTTRKGEWEWAETHKWRVWEASRKADFLFLLISFLLNERKLNDLWLEWRPVRDEGRKRAVTAPCQPRKIDSLRPREPELSRMVDYLVKFICKSAKSALKFTNGETIWKVEKKTFFISMLTPFYLDRRNLANLQVC